MVKLIFVRSKNGSALFNPANLLREKAVPYIHPRVLKQIQNCTIKKTFNNNVSLIADVPGKQPPLHIEALRELAKAWAKISK